MTSSPSVAPAALAPARRRALGLLGVAGALAGYEVLTRAFFAPTHVPPFSTVLPALVDLLGQRRVYDALLSTLVTVATGVGIALVAGVLLGMVIGLTPYLWRVVGSTLDFLRPVPSIVLIPVLVLLLDVGQISVLLVAVSCFWVVLFQALYGIRDLDPVAHDTARSFGLGPFARAVHLTWPVMLPYLATGLRLVTGIALALAVTAGLVMGGDGIGDLIWRAQQGTQVADMYALVVLTGLLGIALDALARAAERRALRWHVATRREMAR